MLCDGHFKVRHSDKVYPSLLTAQLDVVCMRYIANLYVADKMLEHICRSPIKFCFINELKGSDWEVVCNEARYKYERK